jgi:hypothetical protein
VAGVGNAAGNAAVAYKIDSPRDLVSLDRYPITDRQSPQYKKLVEHCNAEMQRTGYCLLQDFVTADALSALEKEAERLAPLAFHNTLVGNAYLTPEDTSIDIDDPRRILNTTALGAVAFDQFPDESLIRRLYLWDGLLEFVADALSYEKLHRYADPLGALNLAVMGEGDHLRWHFDQTDFVVSLLLKPSEGGGEYEVYPMTRSEKEENFDRVRNILNGDREGVLTLDIKPGCLVLFKGRHSLHRVTPVTGSTDRLIALFGYDAQPGVVSSDHLRMIRYGRTG